MRIAIYVVDAEKYQQQLSDVRLDFVTYFGGLTEYPNNKGYWYDKGVLYCDNVSI